MALSVQYHPLLKAAHEGDRTAMEQLLSVCKPDIRRYAQRHCLVSDVDDAVQETMLVLSRRLHSLRALASFSGWLFRVAQRECRRLGRVAFRYDPFDEEKLEHWLSIHTSDTLRAELASALQSLPVQYREVILLRDFEEFSVSEIAARLELTRAAVKSRLHRARGLAREYLLGA